MLYFRITLTLSCPMKLHKFPLDTQTCHIQLESCKFKQTECKHTHAHDSHRMYNKQNVNIHMHHRMYNKQNVNKHMRMTVITCIINRM